MDKTIIVALITGLFTLVGTLCGAGFIQFLISRKDKKEEDKIEKRFDGLEKTIKYIDQGGVRQQIMLLIHLYPQRSEEIMKLGRKYFIDFRGNYYLTSIFKEYMDKNNLTYPTWWDDVKQ